MAAEYDAVIVGAGPNGLAAAVTLARAGARCLLIEAEPTLGGAMRSLPLITQDVRHDIGAAVLPLARASTFFREAALERHGLQWADPEVLLAHPLDGGSAGALRWDLDATAEGLEQDRAAYRSLLGPLVERWEPIIHDTMRPIRIPRHPLALARYGLAVGGSMVRRSRTAFRTPEARALLAGIAGHSGLSLHRVTAAAYGIFLALLGHAVGWPIALGGSQSVADALVTLFRQHGGEVLTGTRVRSLRELPRARVSLLDVSPGALLEIAGPDLPHAYARALRRWRYGTGVFKVDWILHEPVPWRAGECRRAGTVHVGGTLEEMTAAEETVVRGGHPDRPLVIVAQQSVFDPSRSGGAHTLWAYTHVPNGSPVDMTERVERQIERFAPGFRDCVKERVTHAPRALEALDSNLVGGSITGGELTPRQMIARPALRWDPYETPLEGVYLCSSSTPPGGGVHGMCGYNAAWSALRRLG